jgi:large subunit ribosomal protein L29
MDSIVEMRERTTAELEETLEDAREEMFNLRFQRASGQLEDHTRLRKVRQHIARLQTVLNDRERAIVTASREPALAELLSDRVWSASAEFDYELSAWVVTFFDDDEDELATARVDLNRKSIKSRADRAARKRQPQRVTHYEIAG